jgi:hypothetical protein
MRGWSQPGGQPIIPVSGALVVLAGVSTDLPPEGMADIRSGARTFGLHSPTGLGRQP